MTSILLALIGWMLIALIVFLWVMSRLLRPCREPSGVDPILSARDRIAIYRPRGRLIQPQRNAPVSMPDHLTTSEEMVAWMTKEMPKLVENATRPKA